MYQTLLYEESSRHSNNLVLLHAIFTEYQMKKTACYLATYLPDFISKNYQKMRIKLSFLQKFVSIRLLCLRILLCGNVPYKRQKCLEQNSLKVVLAAFQKVKYLILQWYFLFVFIYYFSFTLTLQLQSGVYFTRISQWSHLTNLWFTSQSSFRTCDLPGFIMD